MIELGNQIYIHHPGIVIDRIDKLPWFEIRIFTIIRGNRNLIVGIRNRNDGRKERWWIDFFVFSPGRRKCERRGAWRWTGTRIGSIGYLEWLTRFLSHGRWETVRHGFLNACAPSAPSFDPTNEWFRFSGSLAAFEDTVIPPSLLIFRFTIILATLRGMVVFEL